MKTVKEIKERIQGLKVLRQEYATQWEKDHDVTALEMSEGFRQKIQELEWVIQ